MLTAKAALHRTNKAVMTSTTADMINYIISVAEDVIPKMCEACKYSTTLGFVFEDKTEKRVECIKTEVISILSSYGYKAYWKNDIWKIYNSLDGAPAPKFDNELEVDSYVAAEILVISWEAVVTVTEVK